MSHLYPLAETARQALLDERPAARTRADAVHLAGKTAVEKLATDWVTADSDEAEQMAASAAAGLSRGFVQTYEDEHGRPVYAVTYWRLEGEIVPADPAPNPKPADKAKPEEKPAATPAPDHTDDLYFRAKGGRKRGRKRAVDPRQLDLFMGADKRGYEHEEGGAMITDEEGDGTTFGG